MNSVEALPFVGREGELAKMMQSWEYTKRGDGPSLVVLRGDSGFGKTRLIQEFYADVVQLEQGDGGGVWPPSLGANRNNMNINPVPDLKAARKLPFLWWGTRLSDTTERNRTSTSLNPADLLSLEVLTKEIKDRENEEKAAQGVVKAVFSAVPVVGSVMGGLDVAGALVNMVRTVKSSRFSKADFKEHRDTKMSAGSAGVVDQLDKWIRLYGTESAPPSIIVLDDAQFLEEGGDAFCFFGSLFAKSLAGGWNTLFIVSVWPRGGDIFEKLASPFQRRDTVEVGRLAKIAKIFQRDFPGLEQNDLHQLSDRADGNPLLAGEMIIFVTKNCRLFTGNDLRKGLTEDGRKELWSRQFRLDLLIQERFDDAAESTTFAVAVGSAQGIEFLEELGADLALELGRDGLIGYLEDSTLGAAFDNAADPEYFIARRRDGISEFPHRAYQIEAGKRLRNYAVPDRVEKALKVCLSKAIDKYKDKFDTSKSYLLASIGCAVFSHPVTSKEVALRIEYELLRTSSSLNLDLDDPMEAYYVHSDSEGKLYEAFEKYIETLISEPPGLWTALVYLSSGKANIETVSTLVEHCEKGGLDSYRGEIREMSVDFLLGLAAPLWHEDPNERTERLYHRARALFKSNSDMSRWKNRLNLATTSVGTVSLPKVELAVSLVNEILDVNDEWLDSDRRSLTDRFNVVDFLSGHWENRDLVLNSAPYDAFFRPAVICQILNRDLENVSVRASSGFEEDRDLDRRYFKNYLLMMRRFIYILSGAEVLDGSVSYDICIEEPHLLEIDEFIEGMLVYLF